MIAPEGREPRRCTRSRPTKFEFVINLKAAKAIGLTVPASLLECAHDVIE
jgi:putative ABC transport system substrate-binding protein